MKAFFYALGCLAAATAAFGQTASPVPGLQIKGPPAMQAAVLAKFQAYNASITQFKAHDFVDGEKTIESANLAKPGTPAWNLESAASFNRLAFFFQHFGDPVTARAAAKLALNQLALAEAGFGPATPARIIAGEKAMAGRIYELLYADRATASLYYEAAVKVFPGPSKAAEDLRRIQMTEAEEARKRGDKS